VQLAKVAIAGRVSNKARAAIDAYAKAAGTTRSQAVGHLIEAGMRAVGRRLDLNAPAKVRSAAVRK